MDVAPIVDTSNAPSGPKVEILINSSKYWISGRKGLCGAVRDCAKNLAFPGISARIRRFQRDSGRVRRRASSRSRNDLDWTINDRNGLDREREAFDNRLSIYRYSL